MTAQDRYGLPYTYCGCPLPGTTLGQRLRNALSRYRSHTTNEPDVLRPPPDAAAGTHASDHNAVYLNHTASEHARQRRRRKAERRRQRQRELDAKGKEKDEPRTIVARYRRRETRTQRESETDTHELAFFYPVPLWIGPGSCVTVPFVVDGGACATVSYSFSVCSLHDMAC